MVKPSPKLNKIQEEVLLGSILGDGCIHKCKSEGSIRYLEPHCEKQTEYLLWKNSILKFNFRKFLNKHHFGESKMCSIYKSNTHHFKKWHDLFYSSGKKEVSREILDKVTPLALAVWHMDDGSYNYRGKRICISTQSFGLKGNKIIKKWFKERFNIDCRIEKYTSKINKKHSYISINSANTKRFIKVVKRFIVPSMTYKIGLDEKRLDEANKSKKEYFTKNFKKLKKMSRKNYLKNIKKRLKKAKDYREKNSKKIKKWKAEYYKRNKKKLRIQGTERYEKNKNKKSFKVKRKKYREDNKERDAEWKRKWYLRNREKLIKKSRLRHNRIKREKSNN